MDKVTYEEAKKAKEILLSYIGEPTHCDNKDLLRSKTSYLVWFALNQDYFLY